MDFKKVEKFLISVGSSKDASDTETDDSDTFSWLEEICSKTATTKSN